MYESFYGMTERPFALTPDPAFLYLSSKHSLALSMLEYSLTGQAGFSVVTGEIGSGKTTLIREFLKRPDRTINLGVISNTHAGFGDLLQWVLMAFGIQSKAADKAGRYQDFIAYLVEQYGAGRQSVLIVDEAQNLSLDSLEELRLLSNVNTGKDQLLQMILVGQPELLGNLRRPELRQFAQRVTVHYHLSPLSYPETRDYIRHRLRTARADPNLFDPWAIGAIYYFSTGVPRLINSLSDMALVYGFAESRRLIGIDVVLAVVRDREQGTLLTLPRTTDGITREALIAEIQKAFQEDGVEPAAPAVEAAADDLAVEDYYDPYGPEIELAPQPSAPPPREVNGHNGHHATPAVAPHSEIDRTLPQEERKLLMPIMPTYLDARARRGQVGGKREKRRWLAWLL